VDAGRDAVTRPSSRASGGGSGDARVAAFLERVELAAVELYERVLAPGRLTRPATNAAAAFAEHHREHAAALGEAAGRAATGRTDTGLLEDLADRLERADDRAGALGVLADVEDTLSATYLFALGILEATEGLRLAASILPVESQHAVVLGRLLADPPNDAIPAFQVTDAAVMPDELR
jgi:hypothetical protein